MDIANRFRRSVAAVLLIGAAGCSGGGDGSASEPRNGLGTPPVSVLAGNWNGSATNTATGEVLSASALIDESGAAQLIVTPLIAFGPADLEASFVTRLDPGVLTDVFVPATGGVIGAAGTFFVIHGDVCCGSGFQITASGESLGTGLRSASQLSGSLSSGMLVGSFDFGGKPYSFSLAASPVYSQSLTLQDLAGVYSNTPPAIIGVPAATSSIAVAVDGTVTGSQASGCLLNGNVSIPNTAHNLFRLHLQISNCGVQSVFGPRNGDYDGLGVLLRDAVTFDQPEVKRQVFYYSLIGPVWLGTQGAQR